MRASHEPAGAEPDECVSFDFDTANGLSSFDQVRRGLLETLLPDFAFRIGENQLRLVAQNSEHRPSSAQHYGFLLERDPVDALSQDLQRRVGIRAEAFMGERRCIAPFLQFDDDPYAVVSDGRLFWISDAYTVSGKYPYSTPAVAGINYIRNAVKIVIDAYHGTTIFYVFDNQDPVVAAYRRIFPALFREANEMPADLREHVRYPETLVRAQGEVYSLYHTQNPKVFFQREDVWSVAQQVTLDREGKRQGAPIDPYFVLMQLPGEQQKNEFVLILPFTPANRNNMIGWMAGRSDGENYGKLLVYNFPESRVIDGPVQIEARIDQNAQLSGQFTLWNQQGSRVIRGHLLVIPIGRSLLFVEPIYLQSVSSPMPELRLVVLATQEKLGYGPTFADAMNNLFGEAATAAPAAQPTPSAPGAAPAPAPSATPTQDLQQLVNRAIQEFEDYQRLTSQGKLGEAGQKLEQHKRTLEEIRRLTRP